jgi:hypothetical protein
LTIWTKCGESLVADLRRKGRSLLGAIEIPHETNMELELALDRKIPFVFDKQREKKIYLIMRIW